MQEREKEKPEVEETSEDNRPLDQSEMEQVVGGGGDSEILEATSAGDALGDIDQKELRQRVLEELREQYGS